MVSRVIILCEYAHRHLHNIFLRNWNNFSEIEVRTTTKIFLRPSFNAFCVDLVL